MKKLLLIVSLIVVLLHTLAINVLAEYQIVRVYVDDSLKESISASYPEVPDTWVKLPLNKALDILNIEYSVEYSEYLFTVNGMNVSVFEGEKYYYLDGERKEMSLPCYKIDNETLLMPPDFFIECLSAEIKFNDQSADIYFYSSQLKPDNEGSEGSSDTGNKTDTGDNEEIGLISQYKKADIKILFSSANGIYVLDEKTGTTIAIDESFEKDTPRTSIIEKLNPRRYKKLIDMDDDYIYFIDVIYLRDVVDSNLYRINKDGTQKTLIDDNIDFNKTIYSDENSIFYAKSSYSVTSGGYDRMTEFKGIFELKKGTLEPKKILDKEHSLEGITGGFLVLSEYLSSEKIHNIFAYNISNGKLTQLPSFNTYCSFIKPVDGFVYYGNSTLNYCYQYDLAKNKLNKSSKIDPVNVWRKGSSSNYIFYGHSINDVVRTFAYDKRKGTSSIINTQCSQIRLAPQEGDNIADIGSYNDDFYYYKEIYSYGDSLGNLFNLDKCVIYKSYLGQDEKVLFSTPCMINKMMVIEKRDLISGAYIKVNDKILDFPDARPFIDENNRTQVPVRFVSEALDAEVEWDGSTRTVKISKNDKTVVVKIGEKTIDINGVKKEMDTAAIIKRGRTFVPLRFVSEAFDATVEWNSDTNVAEIK